MHVGIVGAGTAASATAFVLSETTDADITVLEKSGGLCGRAATRRRDDITYDYGANYVKDDNERVVDLLTETLDTTGLVSIDEPIWVFDHEGTVSEGRDTDEYKWTYRQGLTQIAKRLLDRVDGTVHRRTRIERLARDDDIWRLVDSDGTTWGPFDVLVCTPPAPQTAALLEASDLDDSRRELLLEAIETVDYRTIWTAVLGYEFELDRPYYALVNPGKDHEVGWIAREECKPGHVPEGESVLIVQASHEWSHTHYDDPPERNVAELADITASIMDDDRLTSPAWTDHQGWLYALPDHGAPRGRLRSAEDDGLYFAGDWVAGEARVHATLANGLETGERIVRTQG